MSLEVTLERVERLGESGAAEDLRALAALLGAAEWQTRRAAVEAVAAAIRAGRMSDEELDALCDHLIEAAGDRDNAGRRAAAIAALESVGARALPRIAAELPAAAAPARIILAGVAGVTGGAAALPLLEPLTRDADTNVAAAAIAALGRTRARAATPILLSHLQSPDEWLRFAAVGALGELGDARAVAYLEPLLAEPMLAEATASALAEIATPEAARVLARHLKPTVGGALRPALLAALVSLAAAERSWPRAVCYALRAEARSLCHAAVADEVTVAELIALSESADAGSAAAAITALGWTGAPAAVPRVARALDNPATSLAARMALADLAQSEPALRAMMETDSALLPRAELAAALRQAESLAALMTAAQLCVAAPDAETFEAAVSALAHGRDWLSQRNLAGVTHPAHDDPARAASAQRPTIAPEAARRSAESLRALARGAGGGALVEIAETSGALVSIATQDTTEAQLHDWFAGGDEDATLARLAFLAHAAPALAAAEAIKTQRHMSALARARALEVLERHGGEGATAALVWQLTDEVAGVRRAAARALRCCQPSAEAQRALLAALADEDIWVVTEAILTLGTLCGHDELVRWRLRAALDSPHPLARLAAIEALSAQAREREEWRALARMARSDTQMEVRRVAALAFARCPYAPVAVAAARAALRDEHWSVRGAAVAALAAHSTKAALKLLRQIATNEQEEPPVRGAALAALARTPAPDAVEIICHVLNSADPTLLEETYPALLILSRRQPQELRAAAERAAPRVASLISFALAPERAS